MSLEQLQLPLQIYTQLTNLLKEYQNLQTTKKKLQQINLYKDNFIQKLVIIFRKSQTKILNRLKNLQTVNLKYLKDYAIAKNQSNSFIKKRIISVDKNLDLLQIKKSYNYKDIRKNQSSMIDLGKQDQQLYQLNKCFSNLVPSYSVFQSQEWVNLLQQLKVHQNSHSLSTKGEKCQNIQSFSTHQNKNQKQDFHKKLFSVLEQYFLSILKVNNDENEKDFNNLNLKQIIYQLIQNKKKEISQNKQLKRNSILKSDLKRLQKLKEQIEFFMKNICSPDKSKNQFNFLNLFLTKKQIQEKLYNQLLIYNQVQNSLLNKEKIKLFQQQRQATFQQFASKLIKSYLLVNESNQNQNQSKKYVNSSTENQIKKYVNSSTENQIKKKIIYNIDKKINKEKQYKSQKKKLYQQKLQSLSQIIQKDKQELQKLQFQNNQLKLKLKNLEALRQKYQFIIQKHQGSINSDILIEHATKKNKVLSKKSQKFEKLLPFSSVDNDKELLMQCLKKKDQLLELQQKQIQIKELKLQKFSNKIKAYFKQQGIQFKMNNQSQEQDGQLEIDLEDMFEVYSQQVTKQNYEKYPEQKANLIKNIQQKFKKQVNQIKEQYDQKIQNLQQQLNFQKTQRQSAKLGQQSLQKQISKLKIFSQKLINKRIDFQMIHSRTEQLVKTIMETFFNYALNQGNRNSFNESQELIQQLQLIIQNIKLILKFKEKQRQKQRQNMNSYHPNNSPVNIDYRFSGLSAVSNDFSFSKLNKQSYLDYFDNNQDSQVIQESQVISKISQEEDVVPPSRPSYSTTRQQKRQMGVIDIYQRATMAYEDQSVLTYLNTNNNQTKLNKNQNEKLILNINSYEGLHQEFIKFLQTKLQTLKNQIPQQTQHQIQIPVIQKDDSEQLKQIYKKWKLTEKCLEQAQKINRDNEVSYQNFMKKMKQKGVFQAPGETQKKLFYMQKTILEQDKIIQQQKIQFQTTISKNVQESQILMKKIIQSLNSK